MERKVFSKSPLQFPCKPNYPNKRRKQSKKTFFLKTLCNIQPVLFLTSQPKKTNFRSTSPPELQTLDLLNVGRGNQNTFYCNANKKRKPWIQFTKKLPSNLLLIQIRHANNSQESNKVSIKSNDSWLKIRFLSFRQCISVSPGYLCCGLAYGSLVLGLFDITDGLHGGGGMSQNAVVAAVHRIWLSILSTTRSNALWRERVILGLLPGLVLHHFHFWWRLHFHNRGDLLLGVGWCFLFNRWGSLGFRNSWSLLRCLRLNCQLNPLVGVSATLNQQRMTDISTCIKYQRHKPIGLLDILDTLIDRYPVYPATLHFTFVGLRIYL